MPVLAFLLLVASSSVGPTPTPARTGSVPAPAETPAATRTATPRPRTLRDIALEMRARKAQATETEGDRARLVIGALSTRREDLGDFVIVYLSGTVENEGAADACGVRVRLVVTESSGAHLGSVDAATVPPDIQAGRVAGFSGTVRIPRKPSTDPSGRPPPEFVLGPTRAGILTWLRDCSR